MVPKVTALKRQKRNRHRVNVYLDGEYAFALQDIVAVSLKVGQELSPDDILALESQDVFQREYDRVLHYLSYRPRSVHEVRQYLAGRGVEDSVAEAIVTRLQRAGLLDDVAFARFWVENRDSFNPRGRYMLARELHQKGVPDEIIKEALRTVEEESSAYRAGVTCVGALRGLDYPTFRRRLGGFLHRRGFGYDIAQETVQRLWQEMQDGEVDYNPKTSGAQHLGYSINKRESEQ